MDNNKKYIITENNIMELEEQNENETLEEQLIRMEKDRKSYRRYKITMGILFGLFATIGEYGAFLCGEEPSSNLLMIPSVASAFGAGVGFTGALDDGAQLKTLRKVREQLKNGNYKNIINQTESNENDIIEPEEHQIPCLRKIGSR